MNFLLSLMKKFNKEIVRTSIILSFPLLLFCFYHCKKAVSQDNPKNRFSLDSNFNSVVRDSFMISKISNDTLGYNLYQPADTSLQKLPVLFMLHGHGGNHYDWFDIEEGNLEHILDSLIQQKRIPPLVAVSLEAQNSWYVNHDSIQMEDIYIKEFIPFIKNNNEIMIDSESYYIIGNSMGGYGALNYALKYPKLFKSAMLLAPAAYNPLPPEISSSRKIPVYQKDEVFNDSIWDHHLYTNIKLEEDRSIYPKFFLSTGDDDEFDIFNVVVELKSFFEENNMQQEVTVVNGNHGWKVWRECFKRDIARMLEN